jgi:hypothetical protein
MERYPIVITYIRTADHGSELKHALRSLENITNFNGEVYIVGEREIWFNNLHTIEMKRHHGRPYLDQVKKLNEAAKQMPEKFIISMDDVYVTEPTEIGVYNKGELKGDALNYYRRTKKHTEDFLKDHGVDDLIDYECHAPILVERDKLLETFRLILDYKVYPSLQWRSIYGNVNKIESEYFEDQKSKTANLKEGKIISTQFFTDELSKLFTEPSRYEL